MARSLKNTRLGDLLIEKGLLSKEQLLEAIEFQKILLDRREKVPLGEILIQLGYLDKEQLDNGLTWQKQLRRTSFAIALCAPFMFFGNNAFPNPLRESPLTIEAEHFASTKGVIVEPTTDARSDRNVGSIDTNDWMIYQGILIPETGRYRLTLRVASLAGGGVLLIEDKGRSIARVHIPRTNGWQHWEDVNVDLDLSIGTHELKFIADVGGFNLNWFSVTSLDPGPVSILIKGSNYQSMRGVQLEACSDEGAGQNVSYIDTHDFMNYQLEASLPHNSTYLVQYRVAANRSGGELQLRDPVTDTIYDSFVVPNTTGWQKWVTITREVTLPASARQLQIYASQGGFNFNWIRINSIVKPVTTVAPSNLPLKVFANQFSAMQGVQTEVTADIGGGNNVGYIDKGDWLLYGNPLLQVPYKGMYKISLRVASLSEGGEFIIVDTEGNEFARISIPVTYGWQRWTTIESVVELPAGIYPLDIRVTKGGFNLNWIYVEPADKPSSLHLLGADYSAMSGIQLQPTDDTGGGLNVAYIDPGDWLRFDNQPFKVPVAGKYKLTYRIASPSVGGTIRLAVADTGIVLDTSNIPITGGWQRWQSIEKVVSLPAGIHLLSVHMESGYFNFNWLSLEPLNEQGYPLNPPLLSSSSSAQTASTSSRSSALASSHTSSSSAPENTLPSPPPTRIVHHLEGPVGIRWFHPTSRLDGSRLDITEIGGYVIRYKQVDDEFFTHIDIKDPWADRYEFDNLPKGDYYIQIAAFDGDGVFSPFADIQSVRMTR